VLIDRDTIRMTRERVAAFRRPRTRAGNAPPAPMDEGEARAPDRPRVIA
jgi:hypothetical protein